MRAVWNGAVLAESDDTVVAEGNHYFPREAVNWQYFSHSLRRSVCSWKGTATYLTITVDGQSNPDAAWYYPDPSPVAAHIRDRVAFWHGVTVQRDAEGQALGRDRSTDPAESRVVRSPRFV